MPEDNKMLQNIEEHRSHIDAIDKQIVELLNKRTCHSLVIRSLKSEAQMGLYDPRREEEILKRVYQFNEGPLYNDNLRDIYQGIFRVMKELPTQ